MPHPALISYSSIHGATLLDEDPKNIIYTPYIYTIEYYSAIKHDEIIPFAATCMQLAIIILSEERQIPYDITYMWNLKYGTKERIYKTDTDNRLVIAKWEGVGGGEEWECGVSRCKLLYIGWINTKVLYSTGNCIQYLMINHSGKEYKKRLLHVYS